MKNKIIIVALVALIVMSTVLVVYYINSQKHFLFHDEWDMFEYVNDEIETLTEKDEYKVMTLQEQKNEMKVLLKQLETEGYIKNIYYSDELFSFSYANGALGGVSFKTFNDQELDMNID